MIIYRANSFLRKGLKFIFFLFLFIYHFNSTLLFAQPTTFQCSNIKALADMLNLFHYQPLKITDSISVEVFNDFMNLLDRDQIYFLKRDFNDLESKKYLLSQSINNNNCELIKAVTIL